MPTNLKTDFVYDDIIEPAELNARATAINQLELGSTWWAVDTGAANAYVATLSPVPAAYTAGMVVHLLVANTNTGASTLVLNGLVAKGIKKRGTAELAAGDLLAGSVAVLFYDGTQFQLAESGGAVRISEALSGTFDGVNTIFTASKSIRAGSEDATLRGLRLQTPAHYTLSGNQVTLGDAPLASDSGLLWITYLEG